MDPVICACPFINKTTDQNQEVDLIVLWTAGGQHYQQHEGQMPGNAAHRRYVMLVIRNRLALATLLTSDAPCEFHGFAVEGVHKNLRGSGSGPPSTSASTFPSQGRHVRLVDKQGGSNFRKTAQEVWENWLPRCVCVGGGGGGGWSPVFRPPTPSLQGARQGPRAGQQEVGGVWTAPVLMGELAGEGSPKADPYPQPAHPHKTHKVR